MNRRRLTLLGTSGVVIGASLGVFFFAPARLDPVAPSSIQPRGQALVARGKYLTAAADCAACHTAPAGRPFAGGRAFALPFGTLYSSNITSDRKAGIGAWSDAEFVRAVRQGVRRDGQELYPAFPYTAYTNLSTDDVLAIRAYLASIAPQAEAPPPNRLIFPFNQRWGLRGWKLLYMPSQPLAYEPQRSPEWNRGAYLVEGAGHCGECHTPRTLFYGLRQSRKFAGATTQGWKAYNLTKDPIAGIGNWSIEEISTYLSTGRAAGRGTASGPMAEVVDLSLSRLDPSDIRSIVTYLRTVPARSTGDVLPVSANPRGPRTASAYAPAASAGHAPLGLRIFEGACASCHGWNGEGLQTPYAALRGARTVNDPDGTNLINVILHGSRINGEAVMPAFAYGYSDLEIAAVTNYVLAHFGDRTGAVTPSAVARQRAVE